MLLGLPGLADLRVLRESPGLVDLLVRLESQDRAVHLERPGLPGLVVLLVRV